MSFEQLDLAIFSGFEINNWPNGFQEKTRGKLQMLSIRVFGDLHGHPYIPPDQDAPATRHPAGGW